MDTSSFPTLDQVRDAQPAELAVLLSTLDPDDVGGFEGADVEALVVATQKVASWSHALQAVAVDRFAELVVDEQEEHAAEVVALRDAQRAEVEAAGGTWRGGTGAMALPEPDQIAASSLAPLLRISPRTMRTRMNRARALMELPRTLGLALAGDLEPWRADAVVLASRDVAAERLVEFESRLYATDVTELPKPRLSDRGRRAALKADPEGVRNGVRRAPRRRGLRVAPSEVLGLMRWTLEVPDEQSQRLFAAVDGLAQEYLSADRAIAAGAGDDVGRERRTVEAARLDALTDLAMANASVETVVELVVPVDAGRSTLVTRPHPRDAAADFLAGRPRRVAATGSVSVAGADGAGPQGGATVAGSPGAAGSSTPAPASASAAPWVPASPRDGDATDAVGSPVGSAPDDDARSNDVMVDEASVASAVDDVLVDLVLGNITSDTVAAGDLEQSHGIRLGEWLETAANPFLATGPPPPSRTWPDTGSSPHPLVQGGRAPGGSGAPDGAVWFVDGLVEAPGASTLLPEQVVALLAHPDTSVRLGAVVAGDDGDDGDDADAAGSGAGNDATPATRGSDANDATNRTSSPGRASRKRRRYRPGKALAARVRARDRHCRFPGCSVPASRCQLDHVVPYPTGDTAEENLHCLCPAHHGFKHHAGWRLLMSADGRCCWTAPTGRQHTTAPGSRRDDAA